MRIEDTSTPVLLLHCGLGGLAIFRSLGSLGVKVSAVSSDRNEPALRSKYCAERFFSELDISKPESLLSDIKKIGEASPVRPILIAMSDELAIFVAQFHEELSDVFTIGQASGSLVENLANKAEMFNFAKNHEVPVPELLLPKSLDELRSFLPRIEYPVMLKGIMGNKLAQRTGKKMIAVHSESELIDEYQRLEDPSDPNLMVQEIIPGDDDQVYIFNGYFDSGSNCIAGFTGRKIRQFPVHVGCASLGECCAVPVLAELTKRFMKEIGYKGILDIGYRKDPRDGAYKVLDINPRVGQAFRIFVADNGVDVVRAMYLDLTDQIIPQPIVPIEGRRWIIEDYDIVSSLDYHREGTLGLREWVQSFRTLQEGAWFSWRDPVPFFAMSLKFSKKALVSMLKKVRS